MKISLNPRTIFFLANLIVLPLVALSLFNSPQNWGLPATLIFSFLWAGTMSFKKKKLS